MALYSKDPMVYPSFVMGCLIYAFRGAIVGGVTGAIRDRASFFPAPIAAVAPIPAQNNLQQILRAENRR